MEKEIEIQCVVEGRTIGTGFVTIMNGKVLTESAEEAFYATLRKNEAMWLAEAEDEERSNIIEKLTPAQEDKLKEAHGKEYIGTDDDMPDAYEGWLEDLTLEELKAALV